MWYKDITGRFFGLVTKYACDRQTDGQNYDSQDRASTAASRGKNRPAHLHAANAHVVQKPIFSRRNVSFVARVQVNVRADRTGSNVLTRVSAFHRTWSVIYTMTVETRPMNRIAVSRLYTYL